MKRGKEVSSNITWCEIDNLISTEIKIAITFMIRRKTKKHTWHRARS